MQGVVWAIKIEQGRSGFAKVRRLHYIQAEHLMPHLLSMLLIRSSHVQYSGAQPSICKLYADELGNATRSTTLNLCNGMADVAYTPYPTFLQSAPAALCTRVNDISRVDDLNSRNHNGREVLLLKVTYGRTPASERLSFSGYNEPFIQT